MIFYNRSALGKDLDVQNNWLVQLKYEKSKARREIMTTKDETIEMNNSKLEEKNDKIVDNGVNTSIHQNLKNNCTAIITTFKCCYTELAEKLSDDYKLNDEQHRAFMIIVNHSNGKSHLKIGTVK